PWAQPLAQTRLDQLGETAPIASQATLEGQITDAQARFNLRNLLDSTGAINPVQLAILDKLATLLSAPAGTAQLIAGYVAQAYAGGAPAASVSLAALASAPGAQAPALVVPLTGGARPIPPVFPEDLAAVPGIDPVAAQTLSPFVILLDQANTSVNFNTAGPEMMAATIPQLTISDANALAAERDRAYFISVGDIQNRLKGHGGAFPTVGVSTNSQYFLVNGTIRIQNAATSMRALVRRFGAGAQGSVQVLWEREQ
ncbi:MAG TPA: type II secretion system minor pseudopilin GspK, partial [Burkholderiaceae bacterium]|nr:type II secretion system minor pseudopilin GspK [Burkholderiaceae bacterium]